MPSSDLSDFQMGELSSLPCASANVSVAWLGVCEQPSPPLLAILPGKTCGQCAWYDREAAGHAYLGQGLENRRVPCAPCRRFPPTGIVQTENGPAWVGYHLHVREADPACGEFTVRDHFA